MSDVNNLAHSFVAMAKAYEDLPKVQEEFLQANARWLEGQDVIQRLELRLIDRNNEIDTLNATIRKVEAERDDAELRFLEADDKIAAFRLFITTLSSGSQELLAAMEPVIPTPPAEPEVVYTDRDMREAEAEINSDMLLPPQEVNETQPSGFEHHEQQIDQVAAMAEGVSVSADPITALTDSSLTDSPDGTAPTVEAHGMSNAPEVAQPDPTVSGQPFPADHDNSLQTANAEQSALPVTASDDVGYHNEPDAAQHWQAWNTWCYRMIARYGYNGWPQRPPKIAAQ